MIQYDESTFRNKIQDCFPVLRLYLEDGVVSGIGHRRISSLCHQPHLQGLLQFLPSAVIVTQRLVQVHKINVFRQNSK